MGREDLPKIMGNEMKWGHKENIFQNYESNEDNEEEIIFPNQKSEKTLAIEEHGMANSIFV